MQVHASACRERSNSSFAPAAEPATNPAFRSFGSQHSAQIPLWELEVAGTASLPFPERSSKYLFLRKTFGQQLKELAGLQICTDSLFQLGSV